MNDPLFMTPETISLKEFPNFNESILRDIIINDPAVLGLGELEVKDKERMQPGAGRLDILLRDPESEESYEVELQLGKTDESHIIRCLEYWDIERRRYPQYDHIAVLIAEDITSRFLNVISLFNGFVPFIAVKMTAFKINGQPKPILSFVRVLDKVDLGMEDTDDTIEPPADRMYWIKKASEEMVTLVDDDCKSILKKISPDLDLKYNRYYIGITENGPTNNFLVFRPKKSFVRVGARFGRNQSDQLDLWSSQLTEAGLIVFPGGRMDGWLYFRLTRQILEKHGDLVTKLFKDAYNMQR
ncbi:MAG: hypothetical protein QG605_527 [Euryarchaeota archaeon]|nr:hypothetical protein [Euryarchaeota archaeon]